jgi:hypothetical protein
MYCLPRGEKIVAAQGSWIKSNGGLPLPLRAIADNVTGNQRDNVTLNNLLKGLDLDAKDFTKRVDHRPFVPSDTAACKSNLLDAQAGLKAMQEFIDASQQPENYGDALQKLSQVVGQGKAGNWTNLGCAAGKSPWGDMDMPSGTCQAASEFMERLLMELGGGLELGWGRLKPADLPSMMGLHAYQFYLWSAGPSVYKYYGASIVRHLGAKLSNAEEGTTLYVGHDSDLMLILGALGLTWDAKPYAVNSTLPGSMLRFDRDGDTITASYNYVKDFGADGGIMEKVPAVFWSSTKSQQISLKAFQELVETGSFKDCANFNESIADKSSEHLQADLVV